MWKRAAPGALLAAAALIAAGLAPASGGAPEPGLERVCDGLEFPEGPAWDGRGHLFVSNCGADYITRVALDGALERRWLSAADTGPGGFRKTNGMAFHRDGSLFACDFGRNAIVRVGPDRRCEVVADRCEGRPFRGPNDLAFDPKGNLYFTDPVGSNEHSPVGCVYLVERGTRRVRRVAEGMAFPNGVALSADARWLYVAESRYFRVVRFPIREDAALGEMEPWCQLPANGDPDGMAFDRAGNLWVAQFGLGAVRVIDPSGRIARSVTMPGKTPTNLEFAGKGLRTLYITEPETKSLYKLRVEAGGQPLFCAPRPR